MISRGKPELCVSSVPFWISRKFKSAGLKNLDPFQALAVSSNERQL